MVSLAYVISPSGAVLVAAFAAATAWVAPVIETIEIVQSDRLLTSSTHLGGLVEMWLSIKKGCSVQRLAEEEEKEIHDKSASKPRSKSKIASGCVILHPITGGNKAGQVHVIEP